MTIAPLNVYFSGGNNWDYYDQAQQQMGVPYHDEGHERVIHLPDWYGNGYIRSVALRRGVSLNISDLHLHAPMTVAWQAEPIVPFMELHFHMAGSSHATLHPNNDSFALQSGQIGCCYADGASLQGRMEYPAQRHLLMVELTIELAALQAIAPAFDSLLPVPTPRSRQVGFHMRHSSMTPAMHTAVMQLLQCPFTGLARQLYLEGKALELTALYAAAQQAAAQQRPGLALRPDDVERIHAARDLLLQQMEAPPTLATLARQVGLNDCKLKAGFKQVFGTTVFGYLHTHRMEQAHRLLLEGQQSVLEVALSVGYACPSRFTAAFRRQFGVLPSAVARAPRSVSVCARPRARQRAGRRPDTDA
ncbi:MAG: AraC family transcriptional regulator [Chloroflexaceae bacterium]|jgi:AraC-like DNA-binding protein|nr:AraC family transcriptional regulator [Chloroflexaceae bacterium]